MLKSRPEIEQNGLVWGSKRQKVKHRKYKELEKALLEWFQQACSLNCPVNCGVITEKIKQIAAQHNITEFCGLTGWFDRFRSRHGILYRQISSKAGSIIDEDIASGKNNVLPSLLHDYTFEDVHNADEFRLFYKLVPDKSFIFKT